VITLALVGARAAGARNREPLPDASQPEAVMHARAVQVLAFSRRRYPNIRRRTIRAIRRGCPRVMVVNRPGAGARRDRLLAGIPAKRGFDRDE
jgi:hypothetical protein